MCGVGNKAAILALQRCCLIWVYYILSERSWKTVVWPHCRKTCHNISNYHHTQWRRQGNHNLPLIQRWYLTKGSKPFFKQRDKERKTHTCWVIPINWLILKPVSITGILWPLSTIRPEWSDSCGWCRQLLLLHSHRKLPFICPVKRVVFFFVSFFSFP